MNTIVKDWLYPEGEKEGTPQVQCPAQMSEKTSSDEDGWACRQGQPSAGPQSTDKGWLKGRGSALQRVSPLAILSMGSERSQSGFWPNKRAELAPQSLELTAYSCWLRGS